MASRLASFSGGLIYVIGVAVLVASMSWAHFAQMSKGVVVSGAGDPGVNGYYEWQQASKFYVKIQEPARGRRVPNVFDLVYPGPRGRKGSEMSAYRLRKQGRAWRLMFAHSTKYISDEVESPLRNTPPPTGWTAIGQPDNIASLDPPPQMTTSGKIVAPDPDPAQKKRQSSLLSQFMPTDGMPVERDPEEVWEFERYPGTTFLLVVILGFAYFIYSNKVPHGAVAMSYAQIWQKREYWRIFTASFAHFEPFHLGSNVLGTWAMRELEGQLGTFRFLCLILSLVVTTMAVKILINFALIKWNGMEDQRERRGVGFSAVLFAHMAYEVAGRGRYCVSGSTCFDTWRIPILGFPVNLAPFVSLVTTSLLVPRASFTGHLAGIIMGYLTAWGALEKLSIPILAGISAIVVLQHSNAWAHKISSYSLLLKGWTGGIARRVARTRTMEIVFATHLCLAVAVGFLFSWSSVVAEVLALVVADSALNALKCCCWPDSHSSEHRLCLTLLKAYGALSGILAISDLLSFGAIAGQAGFIESSGVSKCSRERGQVLLLVAAAIHVTAVAACVNAGALFLDGQAFLTSIGLKKVVIDHARSDVVEQYRASSSGTYTLVPARSFPGTGQALGTAPVSSVPQSVEL